MYLIRNKKAFLLSLSIVAILTFSSCSKNYRNALFTSTNDLKSDTLSAVYVVNNNNLEDVYRIKVNDLLSVRNLQDMRYIAPSENSTQQLTQITYRVENDGTVALPVIGKIKIQGLTRSEASEKIRKSYQDGLLKDPIIDVSIVNLKVTLLGEFTRQGNYLLLKDNTSLIDIIGEAGGITPRADPKKLKIIRGNPANPEVVYVNLKDINSLSSKKLTLKNDDIIYLEPHRVFGNTERVQIFTSFVQPVLLILNTALIIYNISR